MAARRVRIVLALLVAPALVASGVAFARLHDRPFDFSHATRSRGIELPDWLTGLKQHNQIPFWAHASLAAVLTVTDADPMAVAVQWAKAGSHASQPFEVKLAARGVRDAAGKFDSSYDASRFFCRFSRNDDSRRLGKVVAAATIDCSAPS